MYLTKEFAQELLRLGFKRPYYDSDEVTPYDFYSYEGEEWVLGGRILPEGPVLSPEQVYKSGTLLPKVNDLMNWLEFNGYTYSLIYKNTSYRVEATNGEGILRIGKGGTPEHALFVAIEKILKEQK